MVCFSVLLSPIDFIVVGSDHILSSFPSTHLNMSVGPNELGFVGCLDLLISVLLELILLDFSELCQEVGLGRQAQETPVLAKVFMLDVFSSFQEMFFRFFLKVFLDLLGMF